MRGRNADREEPGLHHHDAISPISFRRNVPTSVLILHGEEHAHARDRQGQFLARSLHEYELPYDLVVSSWEGDAFRQHQFNLMHRPRAWVERWLGSGYAPDRGGRDYSRDAGAPEVGIHTS
jgi:hypothetical protein